MAYTSRRRKQHTHHLQRACHNKTHTAALAHSILHMFSWGHNKTTACYITPRTRHTTTEASSRLSLSNNVTPCFIIIIITAPHGPMNAHHHTQAQGMSRHHCHHWSSNTSINHQQHITKERPHVLTNSSVRNTSKKVSHGSHH